MPRFTRPRPRTTRRRRIRSRRSTKRSGPDSIAGRRLMRYDPSKPQPIAILKKDKYQWQPSEKMVVVEYTESFGLTNGTAGITGSQATFAINGTFDPNLTGVGHQPYLRDQIAQLYNRYLVTECTVCIEVNQPATPNMTMVAMIDSTSAARTCSALTPQFIDEQNVGVMLAIPDFGNCRAVVRQHLLLWEVFGFKTQAAYLAQREDYAAAIGANPSRLGRVLMAVAAPAGASSGFNAQFTIHLAYKTLFYDRIDPGAS